jgi:predicted nucleic acid-binding Zn ribbon protein
MSDRDVAGRTGRSGRSGARPSKAGREGSGARDLAGAASDGPTAGEPRTANRPPVDRKAGDPEERRAGSMQRIGDLLPQAARKFGLEQELELATVMSAWERLVAAKVPAAVGSCRIVSFSQGVATVEADEPIVAQELRLRGPELVAALRTATGIPARQLRITARHV